MEFYILPILLTLVGSYFLIKLRFFFILHPFATAARGLRSLRDSRAVRSFLLALAGTLGVGNVFGVAIGLLMGGAGSLFWLLVSMMFAMVIKYCEVALTADNLYHDTDTHGGFYYVLRNSFARSGAILSALYAVVTLVISLVMGAALQTDAIVESLAEVKDIPWYVVGGFLVILTLFSIAGGAKKIERITAVIIPLSTIIYIFITLCIISTNISRLADTVELIIHSAFSPHSAAGGILAFLTSSAMREGFARGILSNEAGAGTSAMAHSRSGILSPASAGLLGIFEVWFDTGLICMLTGLSILLSVEDISAFDGGMQLVMHSVGNLFGSVGKTVVLMCVFAFAFATVICWYYYGSESWSVLFGRRMRLLFLPIFLLAVMLGCYLETDVLVYVTDIFMAAATALTLSALIKNSDRVKTLSERGGVIDTDYSRVFKIKGSVFLRGGRRR